MSTERQFTLPVVRLQRFSTGDGPGVRTTVFLQGCPLSCAWCHNPETQPAQPVLLFDSSSCIGCGACIDACPTGARKVEADTNGRGIRLVLDRTACRSCGACDSVCPTGACEMSARPMTAEELVRTVLRDAPFFGAHGGVTLSGGEPLMHASSPDLLEALHEAGLHVAVETCGAISRERILAASRSVDLWLYDIKDTDPTRLRRMTGGDMDHIFANLLACDACTDGRIRLRCILVNHINHTPEHWRAVAALSRRLRHCEGVEILPYHAFAGSKAQRLGRPDNGHPDWIPTPSDIADARSVLRTAGATVVG